MFNYVKQNFRFGDRVRLVRLGGDLLEDLTGTVVGLSFENVFCVYLVKIDNFPTETYEWSTVAITEVCLEKI